MILHRAWAEQPATEAWLWQVLVALLLQGERRGALLLAAAAAARVREFGAAWLAAAETVQAAPA